MGVYINMEMPETCKLCYLSEFDPGFYAYVCKATEIRIDYDMAKIDRPRTICPLVPVPPHGRLIDADTLCMKLKMMYAQAFGDGNSAYHSAYRSLEKVVEHEPTVIDADKEGGE